MAGSLWPKCLLMRTPASTYSSVKTTESIVKLRLLTAALSAAAETEVSDRTARRNCPAACTRASSRSAVLSPSAPAPASLILIVRSSAISWPPISTSSEPPNFTSTLGRRVGGGTRLRWLGGSAAAGYNSRVTSCTPSSAISAATSRLYTSVSPTPASATTARNASSPLRLSASRSCALSEGDKGTSYPVSLDGVGRAVRLSVCWLLS